MGYIDILGQRAQAVKAELAQASTDQKNDALLEIAHILRNSMAEIIDANGVDIANGKMKKMSESLLDRLALTEGRIESMASACESLAKMEDPVGEIVSGSVRPNGMRIEKIRVPMGVIGMIYEARPNVTVDAAILCLKSGNAVILRGGKEAINSNKCLADLMRTAVRRAGFSEDIIQLVEDTDRGIALDMMKANEYIDVLIPRGGAQLIKAVVQTATVPVIETGTGNCHVYVDSSADINMAVDIVDNGKTQRPSVCNAVETCLVHRDVAERFLPKLKARLDQHNVEIRGCEMTAQILGSANVVPADEEDYATEFGDYIIAIKVVDDLAEAFEHIARYSTGHSECIVTESLFSAEEFKKRIDAAAVYVNCSTRFTDGEQFGLGAEIGISTQKLHARGPMGLKEMTTTKFVITGNGQIRK
ncbi:MAG: glutamate-5-semialdehyde dehydrogenase [Ruminococcus sp.]|nr:glutamate-5-semialdehyde dehydrogenase [Ruminococcus sp.]